MFNQFGDFQKVYKKVYNPVYCDNYPTVKIVFGSPLLYLEWDQKLSGSGIESGRIYVVESMGVVAYAKTFGESQWTQSQAIGKIQALLDYHRYTLGLEAASLEIFKWIEGGDE